MAPTTPRPPGRPRAQLEGQRFGKLTIIVYERPNWLCRCDCGKDVRIDTYNLRRLGDAASCAYRSRRRPHRKSNAQIREAIQRGDYEEAIDILAARTTPSKTRCWVWEGALDPRGYGNLVIPGWGAGAHRVVKGLSNETPVHETMTVHHTCANRKCVNPEHLQTITPIENTAEMVERNAYLRRIAKLEAQVEDLQREINDLRNNET